MGPWIPQRTSGNALQAGKTQSMVERYAHVAPEGGATGINKDRLVAWTCSAHSFFIDLKEQPDEANLVVSQSLATAFVAGVIPQPPCYAAVLCRRLCGLYHVMRHGVERNERENLSPSHCSRELPWRSTAVSSLGVAWLASWLSCSIVLRVGLSPLQSRLPRWLRWRARLPWAHPHGWLSQRHPAHGRRSCLLGLRRQGPCRLALSTIAGQVPRLLITG